MRQLVSAYLTHISYDVVTASNGLEGANCPAPAPTSFDAVLKDLHAIS